jgi:WD40 repeat protein
MSHYGGVNAIAITRDESKIISGGGEGAIKVWNLLSGELIKSWDAHNEGISALAITPDGSKIVSGGVNEYDKTIKVWDLSSGRLIISWEGHDSNVRAVAVTPDGTKIVSGSHDCAIKVWSLPGDSFRNLEENSIKEPDSNDQIRYHLSKFYIWFNLAEKGSGLPGALTTREYAANISISVDQNRWFCEKASDPRIGTYWTLYPKEHVIIGPKESITLKIDDIVSENKPGMTWINIRYHILGQRYETHRIPIIMKY